MQNCSLLDSISNTAYGCVFCKTGTEDRVAERLRLITGVYQVFVAKQIQHVSRSGQKSNIHKTMIPGYAFFCACTEVETALLSNTDDVLRLLSYEGSWALQGGDLEFVKWLEKHDGMLGMSKVYREGEKIVITEGPLKEMEGTIIRIDRHNRNGQVEIDFCGKKIKAWLAFEYVTEAKE